MALFVPFALSKNADLLQLAQNVSRTALQDPRKVWGEISGGYYQTGLGQFRRLRDTLANQAKQVLASEQIDVSDLVPVHLKLLRAPPGKRFCEIFNCPYDPFTNKIFPCDAKNIGAVKQHCHMDGLAKRSYVVAYYLTSHTSTEISTYPYPKDLNVAEASPEELQAISEEYWNSFRSYPTQPGDMMIFPEDYVHRGAANDTNEDRLVMFLMLVPKGVHKEHTDEYQFFELNWVEAAYGKNSVQYQQCLEKYKNTTLLDHFR